MNSPEQVPLPLEPVKSEAKPQIAPSSWTEIHEDFLGANKKSSIATCWIAVVILAPFLVSVAYYLGGWLVATCALLLSVALPILTMYSYKANIEIFRYYTWIFRTTQPVKGQIQIFTSHGRAGIFRTADVTIGKRKYQCDVVPNTTTRIASLSEGSHEMSIVLIPDTGEPLCAELGELRIWLEPSMLRR